jgi:hypothetical protein
VPINIFGDLKVVVSNDIGSLGETTGPSVAVTWSLFFALARMASFLFILALMFLRANRCSSAWWVWLPLLGTSVILTVLASLDWNAPGEIIDVLQHAFGAVIMGLAVLWLMAPYFGRLSRGLGFVALLLAVGVFGAIDVALGVVNGEGAVAIPSLIFVAAAAVHTAVTFLLASLHCRHRFSRGRFLLWLFIWMLATGLLIAVPLGLLASAVSREMTVVFMVILFIASVSVASFVVQLPLYLLAFFHPFYRERSLKLLGPPPPPPVPPPPPPPAATAA